MARIAWPIRRSFPKLFGIWMGTVPSPNECTIQMFNKFQCDRTFIADNRANKVRLRQAEAIRLHWGSLWGFSPPPPLSRSSSVTKLTDCPIIEDGRASSLACCMDRKCGQRRRERESMLQCNALPYSLSQSSRFSLMENDYQPSTPRFSKVDGRKSRNSLAHAPATSKPTWFVSVRRNIEWARFHLKLLFKQAEML